MPEHAVTLTCHHCGGVVEPPGPVQRTDSCPTCYSDLKCCLNCAFHDPGRDNQCAEPAAEWVPEKAKANFCEFFTAVRPAAGPGAGAKANARSAFDSLFKK
jgi:hypothetical protein